MINSGMKMEYIDMNQKYNYNQIIEYIDCTWDENFNAAREWASSHNTTFEEDLSKRDLPKRYFVIGPEYLPSEEELKMQVRSIRNLYLSSTDFTQLPDSPFTGEEKSQYAEYRQYLRDYTDGDNWWLENPKTFDEWKS